MGVPAVDEAMEVLREQSGRHRARAGSRRCATRCATRSGGRSSARRTPCRSPSTPWVVFVVGVNGVGKTTTIGKLAAAGASEGRSVLLCAADTFRAAAAEQLEIWAERSGAGFHRGAEGADPSSVLTDALRAARARGDGRGARRHRRSAAHEDEPDGRAREDDARGGRARCPGAPHETLLVLDATVGANGLAQGREFAKAGGVTGLVLTKLDGTAKGGIAVAVVRELGRADPLRRAWERRRTTCCRSTPRPSPARSWAPEWRARRRASRS